MNAIARVGGDARLRLPADLLALAALALVACGSAGGTATTRSATARSGPSSAHDLQALKGAAAAGVSGTATFTVTLDGATVFGRSPSVHGGGSFDFGARRGTVSLSPAGTALKEALVFAPQAVYIQPPAGSESLPRGKSWIMAGLSDTRALNTNLPGFVTEVESLNPALTLNEVLWGATSAALSGTDTVRGQKASRYDVKVDLAQALAAASGSAQAPLALALRAEIRSLGGSAGPPSASSAATQIGVRAWVGDSGRLLRVQLTPPGAGVGSMTLDLTAFGTAVQVGVPPADQVTDVAALTPAAERENNNGGDSDGA
jgi:hypothetical protein